MDVVIGILLLAVFAGLAWLVFTGPPAPSSAEDLEHLKDVSINVCTFQQIRRLAKAIGLTDKEDPDVP